MRPETRASSGGGSSVGDEADEVPPQMGERGKKVSRLDRICGSILHAAHVPLTATVCLFPALASIVSYTLDRQPATATTRPS